MSNSRPHIVFGTGGVGLASPELLDSILETLQKHTVKELDTAYIYPNSEVALAKAGAPSKFLVSTKAPGFNPGAMNAKGVIDGMEESLKRLGVDSVEIYYLHSPDAKVPLEDTLSGIQQLYKAGKFKRFGISNYKPADVQKIYDIQSAASSVLPSVFQGNYNPISRHIEGDLFPLLRKLKISFYAYSPIAGGFLVKDPAELRSRGGESRFSKDFWMGNMYGDMYGKETLFQAVEEWAEIAAEEGISKAALAYRWVVYHSALVGKEGDALILGASKVAQLEETLNAVEDGPLSKGAVAKIEKVWEKVKADAPLDNYHSYALLAQQKI